MLELPLEEYRVVYKYSDDVSIEIYKISLDWAWVVKRSGKPLRSDIASSESGAEEAALKYAKGC